MSHFPDSTISRNKLLAFRRAAISSPREEVLAAMDVHQFYCNHYEPQIAALEAKLKEYQGHEEILKKLAKIEYLLSNPAVTITPLTPAPHIE